jgi:hypothetical protein
VGLPDRLALPEGITERLILSPGKARVVVLCSHA